MGFAGNSLVLQYWEVGIGSGFEVSLFSCATRRADTSGQSLAAIMSVAGLSLLCLDRVGADLGSGMDLCSLEGGELISKPAVIRPVVDMMPEGLFPSLLSTVVYDPPVLPVDIVKSGVLSSGMTPKLASSILGDGWFT